MSSGSSPAQSQVRNLLGRAEAEYKACNFRDARAIFEMAAAGLSSPRELPPRAVAFYALSLAATEPGRTAEAIEMCRVVAAREAVDASPCFALASLYMKARNRRRALRSVEEGLRMEPDHFELLRLRAQLGRRGAPTLGFLRRGHPLNIFFGRLRHALRG